MSHINHKIWLPGMRDEPKPLVCRLCHDRFARNDELVAHIEDCYASMEPEILAVVAEHKEDHMDIPDPEWRDYNEKLSRDGIDPMEQYSRGRRSNIRRASES